MTSATTQPEPATIAMPTGNATAPNRLRIWPAFCCVLLLCDAAAADDAVAFVQHYCADCHTTEDAPGGVILSDLHDAENFANLGKRLLHVLDVVDSGVMPPPEANAPDEIERRAFCDAVTDMLLLDDGESPTVAPPPVIRRLNRNEYRNTVRDLFGAEIDVAADFPADDIGFGFDNIGSALNVSPLHLERYLAAAETAAAAAIRLPEVDELSPTELIGLRTYPLPPDEQVDFEHHLKPGRYLVDFSLVRVGVDEGHPTPRLVLSLGQDHRTVRAQRVQDETAVYRVFLNVAAGDDTASVAVAKPDRTLAAEGVASVGVNVSGDQRYGNNRGLHVDSMVVRGPLPEVSVQPDLRHPLLTVVPKFGDNGRIFAIRDVVRTFATRAFRRPVSTAELNRLMRIADDAHERGESFEATVRLAVTAVLVSPQFLYLAEPDESGQDRPLTEYELASRLSYFLWSSMPDEELFQAAAEGRLKAELHQHVERMLDDPRSGALVTNFAGQWLQLRNLAGAAPDPQMFPEFDTDLIRSMRQETEHTFAWILRENRSILELLDADYVFVNERLANHYELDGITGNAFQKVTVGDNVRGGVLTQAGILTLTSHHNRTSPVKRGQWILQQLLGTAPPPPPPDVAQLDESPQAMASASLRERMELHRSNPECAACHQQMDPLGFGLENFDAVGRWRTRDGEFPIDASGVLPGNREFQGVAELKRLLRDTASRRFCWSLTENLMVYALGRSLTADDYRLVERIRHRLTENDFRIHEIIFAIVDSDAFQRRGSMAGG